MRDRILLKILLF